MPKLLQFTVCFTLAFNVNEVCPFYLKDKAEGHGIYQAVWVRLRGPSTSSATQKQNVLVGNQARQHRHTGLSLSSNLHSFPAV